MYKWDIPESYSNKNIGEYQYDTVDYLPNNNSIPIISNRLKVFFEKNLPKIA
ncbi:hypothetical protein [Xenorhabdus szentirmaii]|uniref:Uncharacterized protein n=2 Tax=Xenorhabdus szentirmaii TaxID=290112 RepID=W1IW89_9GAMM|nr:MULTISPECIES: hypothetical protein [Xenorhabdus]MBD2780978.1 hypothetical protein [Xenorhabdus sp. 38]MBD2801670.1 hypothetical protein [Xenorhabdus sp. M]PHM33917.1 hypothetical protein Xsze_00308 [Xenorhabdus szentirmaii DSM 16338]PHM42660.1 hypothetical protein Xszus_02404 [Xenorhabdus szentirmaii]CDL81465.1 hypothetical protein XSR1_130065 [Xenorhabdus szentirmaii DSM 16338]